MQKGLLPEVVDVTTLCPNCPRKVTDEISRDNVLHTIDLIFEGDTELVMVYGPEGMGKTTLLAQFARRHSDRALCLFIRPSSRYGYDPELIALNLCTQMLWLLGKQQALEITDSSSFSRLIYDLQRSSTHKKPYLYFVIDGLDEIPPEDFHLRDQIVARLPLGLRQFKFLCAAETPDFGVGHSSKLRRSSFPLTPLTSGETNILLAGGLSREQADEFYRVSRGIPGYLAGLRRMMNSGIPANDIVDQLPSSLPELFEMEWRRVKESDTVQVQALAILAHDRTKHSVEDLAFFLGVEPSGVVEALQRLNFIELPQSSHEEVQFASDAFRRFAASQLSQWRDFVNDCLIKALLKDPLSQRTVARLPDYLGQANRNEELLTYLSPQHFARMLAQSQSIVPVRRHAELGLAAARELRNDADLVRFGIQEAAISDLDGFAVSSAEIEARMALGDHESALALAYGAVLKHDRLRLLVVFARAKKSQGLSPDPDILQQIQQLLNEIDVRDLGDAAVDLAIDLMSVNTDSAIKVVERMAKSPDGRSLDFALARLSFAGICSKEKEEGESKRAAEAARMKIKDPELFRFSTGAALILGRHSPEDIITEVEKVTNPLDRLFFLRQWAKTTREYEGCLKVVKYAFEMSLRTAEYTPTATHYRELATPLPRAADPQYAKELVGLFDSQQSRVEQLGPSEDYVRLQLLLAEAEASYDFSLATSRLLDVYLFIDRLPDIVTKAACLAFFISTLCEVDPAQQLESSDKLHSWSQEELHKYVDQLLHDTAQHEFVVHGVLDALACTKPDLAVTIAESLNVESRRDESFAQVVRSQLQAAPDKVPFERAFGALDKIRDSDLREHLLCDSLEHISNTWSSASLAHFADKFVPFIELGLEMSDPVLRTRSCSVALSLLSRCAAGTHLALADRLVIALDEAWNAIDDDWIKVDVGFEVSRNLADHCREIATHYLTKTDTFRKNLPLYDCRSTYLMAVRLAIRAFSGLAASGIDTEEELMRLRTKIDRIPSVRIRALMWSDLALRLFRDEQPAKARKLVNEKLRPALGELEKHNKAEWSRLLVVSAPALYQSHKKLALELVATLPTDWVDLAYDATMDFIFSKHPNGEPFDGTEKRFLLTYEEAVDICELLQLVSTDWVIYRHLEYMVESLLWKKNNYSFTQEQRTNIIKRLESVIDTRLPTPRFIRHDGYKIIARAQLARLKKGADWANIRAQAVRIANLADRAMVLAVVGRCVPVVADQQTLFLESLALAQQVPSLLDKVDRLQILASECYDSDVTLCKSILRQAMQLSAPHDDPEFGTIQRRIIDLAQRISPELATSLVSAQDDDPARIHVRQHVGEHLEVLELRGRLADESESPDKVLQSEDRDSRTLGRAAWMTLGSLNANRVMPIQVSHTREYVQKAAKWPLSRAYPVLSWVIQNACMKLRKTDAAHTVLRGMFSAAILGADLAANMELRTTTSSPKSPLFVSPTKSESFVVRAGERDRALRFLEAWLRTKVFEWVKICDPYLGPEEVVSICQMILAAGQKTEVTFLTSRRHQPPCEGYEEFYKREWRRVSDQDPPDTQVVIAGVRPNGDSPIHDRWWLTSNSGLRLGTSFSSMGITKDSELAYLRTDELGEREAEINECVYGIKRIHKNEKIDYTSFSL